MSLAVTLVFGIASMAVRKRRRAYSMAA